MPETRCSRCGDHHPRARLIEGEHCAVPGCTRLVDVVARGLHCRYWVCSGHEPDMWEQLARDGYGRDSHWLDIARREADQQEALDA